MTTQKDPKIFHKTLNVFKMTPKDVETLKTRMSTYVGTLLQVICVIFVLVLLHELRALCELPWVALSCIDNLVVIQSDACDTGV